MSQSLLVVAQQDTGMYNQTWFYGGSGNSLQEEKIKEYHTDELTVYWYPKQCSHAGKCWGDLPEVFDLDKKPWIDLNKASTEAIIKAIDKCPSDALKYKV